MRLDNIEVLWEYCTGLLNDNAGDSFSSLSTDDQALAKANAEEHLLAYLFIQNSSAKMGSLKRELQNDFTKGHDQYSDTQSMALMFLDRYSRTAPTPAASEGPAFMQKGKSSKKGTRGGNLDKKKEGEGEKKKDPFVNMWCFRCNKTSHPARFCPNTDTDHCSCSSSSKVKDSLST